MSDNTGYTAGSGTTIATDEVGGVHFQKIKIDVGAADATALLSTANPLPISDVASFAEDSAHVSGDKGTMALGVRKDTAAALAGTDGDYSPFQLTPTGAVRVAISEDAIGSILDADSVAKVTINSKYISNGATDCIPKYAKIAASTSGNNTLVAAVTAKKIRVLAYNFAANGTVNAKFQTAAGGTDLTGLKYCAVNTGICAPFNPVGWFETVAGDLLNLNLSAAVAVGGELVYIEI